MVLVSTLGNVASYLGWTGCLESGKEKGAGSQDEDRSLWRRWGLE